MADTTNYEWAKPTVGGDTGAWGTILNAAIDAIDLDLFAAEAKADVSLAERMEQPLILTQGGSGANWTNGLVASADLTDSVGDFVIPLPHLRSGMQILSFSSMGNAHTGAAATVQLCYRDAAGSDTIVSAGHSLPSSQALTTTSGLTHDIDIDRGYFIRVVPSGVAGFVNVWYIRLELDRPE